MLETDEEIVLKVKNGNIDSFAVLLGRYEDKIARYAQKFIFDREDSQDLVQDTFLKTYINIQSFDDSKKFSPWIYRIAHNIFINELKKKTLKKSFFLEVDFDAILPQFSSGETSDGLIKAKEVNQMLELCLSKLKEKYREPIVLFFIEELSYAEISEILQVPVSTVGVRINRGKKQLQLFHKQLTPSYE